MYFAMLMCGSVNPAMCLSELRSTRCWAPDYDQIIIDLLVCARSISPIHHSVQSVGGLLLAISLLCIHLHLNSNLCL